MLLVKHTFCEQVHLVILIYVDILLTALLQVIFACDCDFVGTDLREQHITNSVSDWGSNWRNASKEIKCNVKFLLICIFKAFHSQGIHHSWPGDYWKILSCLRWLREDMKRKLPDRWRRSDRVFHHIITRPHTAFIMQQFFIKMLYLFIITIFVQLDSVQLPFLSQVKIMLKGWIFVMIEEC